jgi:fused signal recognition particle receptor
MFKSSSKLDEGLEAIVQEGGTEDAASEADMRPEARPQSHAEAPARAEPRADEVAAPSPEPRPEHKPIPESGQIPDSEPIPEPEPGPEPQPEPAPEPQPLPEPEPGHAPPQIPEPHPEPQGPRPTPEPPGAPQPADPMPEPAPQELPGGAAPREVPQDTPPDEIPQTPQGRPGFFGRLLGRGGGAPEPEAGAPPPVALQTRADQRPEPMPMPEPAPQPAPEPLGPVVRRVLDDDMLESLEELLIATDMGVDTALRVAANLAEGRMGRRLSTREIKRLLADEIARIMEPVARPLPLYAKKPQVVLVVGVNGSGKTTTIGKLASQFRAAGKNVVIAAGDTFRAAAVEQLQIWGDRAGVPVMTAPEGSDPASLAFDAMAKAEAEGADLLMIDTAGRLQNRQDLMEELAKIVRVIRKRDESAPHNTLLVLDATTGQNALSQVETFQKLADVSGLVMTKLDGTARGGVLVALADKFGLPIHAIGVGEQIDDLAPFDPEDFARALTGADDA